MTPESSTTITDTQWDQLAPILDELVGKLSGKDHLAVLLRFYQDKSFREVGEAMRVSEEAARKRVERAVGKLREMFARRGLTVMSAAALAAGLGAHATQPATAALLTAATITTVASARGAVVAEHLAGLIKGAFKMIAGTKVKLIAAVGLAVLLPLTAGTILSPLVLGQKQDATVASQATASGRPVATPSDPRFSATLPNGLILEVVGVSYSPSQGHAWWKPDGSPLPERPYEAMPNAQVIGGVESREFAVRVANQPAEPATVRWDVAVGGGATGALIGPRFPDLEGRAVAWQYAAATTAVTFHVAAGPWQTVHVNRSFGGGEGNMCGQTDAAGAFLIYGPVWMGGETQITVVDDRGDFDSRIIALDKQNGEHVGKASSVGAGVTRLTVARFADLLPEQIEEIRFQTRPFDITTRLDGISMIPGRATQVKVESHSPGPAPATTSSAATQTAVPVERLMEDMVRIMGDATATLAGVTDEATARAAVSKLDESAAKLRQVKATSTSDLAALSPETQHALAERYRPAILKLMTTWGMETDRVRRNTAIYAILRSSLNSLQQAMTGT